MVEVVSMEVSSMAYIIRWRNLCFVRILMKIRIISLIGKEYPI